MNHLTLLSTISHHNKYYIWYFNICQAASNRDSTEYSEKHHIIPRSLKIFNDKDTSNLVKLTAREHYIVHLLLTKFLINKEHTKKMKYAFWYLSVRNIHYKPNARTYELSKKLLVESIKTRVDTDLTRQKKARPGKLNGMYGKTHTNEVKQKLAALRRSELTGKSYEELHGVEKANQLKNDRAHKLKLYIAENPLSRSGSNNPKAKTYTIVSPHREIFTVIGGLQRFCADHSLSYWAMGAVARGKLGSYNGWTITTK